MKKIIIIIIITFIVVITIIFRNQEKKVNNLINPGGAAVEQTATPSPTPKTFKFDASTDLEKELDNVNPQVIDSDFNE